MKRNESNHKSNQRNPNNVAHRQIKDSRANQKNPNNKAYQESGLRQEPSRDGHKFESAIRLVF